MNKGSQQFQSFFEGGSPEKNSSLDTQVTSSHSEYRTSYRDFLVSGIQQKVAAGEKLYESVDAADGKNRLALYRQCRTDSWFVRHKVSGKIRLASNRCSLRWCPLCIKTKRFIILQSVVPWMKNISKPKFLTLTLKSSDAPLSHQITSLYKFFGNLRRRPWFKKRVKGGVWFFQVTYNSESQQWHPHLHILFEGRFLPQAELSDIWSEITHGSSIVDIRSVTDVKKSADYVARYASCPCELSKLEPDLALELYHSMLNRRICGTFGSAGGVKLSPTKCPDASDWEFLCGFNSCLWGKKNNEWYGEIWSAFVGDRTCYATNSEPYPDRDVGSGTLDYEPQTFKQLVFDWSTGYYQE